MIIKFNMAANMSDESDLIGFIYPDHSKVLCDGIMDLYQSKAWTDCALKVTGGCETLVHTFMLSLFAPKLISYCQDSWCDLQGFNVDQDTISTLLDFIYNGQVMVNRHKLDIIRRGADLMGFKVLSKQIRDYTEEESNDSLSIDEETKQDSIDSSSSETEFDVELETERIIHSINSDKPPKINKDAILRCSRCGFKVEIVGNRPSSVNQFKDHLAKAHQIKMFECHYCDFVTDRKKSSLNWHLRIVHPSEKPFKCLECDFHTTSSSKLRLHRSVEHNPGEFECDECGRKFARFAAKHSHYMMHLQFEDRNTCYLCSFKAKMRDDLKQHLIDEHKMQEKGFKWPKIYKDYEEKKQCTHCEAVLKNHTLLIDHLADKHKVDIEGKPVEPKYKCKSCDLVAYSRHQLYRHNYTTHSKVGYRCNKCDFKCHNRSDLSVHIWKRHPGEKTSLCEVCGQSFVNKSCLTKHQQVHAEMPKTKWKQFQCEFCDRRFNREILLKQHIVKVHADKPRLYECELCSYAARVKRSLDKHVKTKHKETPLQVVEDREDIRECKIVIVKVESCQLAVEHAESS